MADDIQIQKMDGKSLDVTGVNKEKLKTVFPECFTEGNLDIDKLLSLCGEYIDNDFEKYKFEWKGKSECYRIAGKRSTGTLRPCPEESVDFENTNNLYIEGDNLEVLKLLQTAYYRKVKMIYIDPPYNTGNDFVYEDDFKDPMAKYKEITSQTTKSNPETMGRYHTNWLNMMYPRLRLASNLLRDDGVIFISIDDNEVTNLRKICDEVFGEESFVTTIHVELSATQGMKVKAAKSGNIVKNAEYILVYSKQGHKNIATTLLYDYRPKYDEHYSKYLSEDNHLLNLKDVFSKKYPHIKIENLSKLYDNCEEFKNFVNTNTDKILADDKITGFDITHYPEIGKVYPVSKDDNSYLLYNNGNKLRQLLVLSDSFGQCDDFENSFGLRKIRGDWWKDFYRDMGNVSKEGEVVFANGKKPLRLIKQIVKMCTSQTDIILDFFSGSATTAHAVMQLNAEDGGKRQFIMVQLPEVTDEKSEAFKAGYKNICEIGKERIRRAGLKYIKDAGVEVRKQETQQALQETGQSETLLNLGMVSSFNTGNGTEATYKNGVVETFSKDGIEQPLTDIGFKVFKLDTSNLVKWDDTPIENTDTSDLFNRMDGMVESIKKDRSELDVVYEVMLKLGIPLTYKVFENEVNGRKVYSIGDDGLILVCLDGSNGGITPEDISAMCDLTPAKIVAAEEAFKDDVALSNAYYISKDKGVEIELL